MLSKTILAVCGAIVLGGAIGAPALARTAAHHHHATVHRHMPAGSASDHAGRDAEGYASARDCAARLPYQPGDGAIRIQDRFYRESVGDPFWAGECR
jgi:hypothetical protein